MKLTVKQKKFADEYIISGNATQSAIKAGYAKKTACSIGPENLRKPQIKAYIDERLAQIDDAAIAKQEEVLKYLTSVLRGQSASEVVVVEGIGDGASEARTVTKAPDVKERLKAAELLGKRYGLYTDKVDASVTGTIVFEDLDNVPDWSEDKHTFANWTWLRGFWRTRKRYRVVKGSRASKKSKTISLGYMSHLEKSPF